MARIDDLQGRLKEILATGSYKITESDSIPGPGDNRLTFLNTAVQFTGSVLYIDMRGSTKVLAAHKPHTVAKIHKAFLYATTTILAANGGQIRSYNGDSILAFFPKNHVKTIESAVKTALQIKYVVQKHCVDEFSKYWTPNFGIGVDHGTVLCVKAGKGQNDNHSDLLWLGHAVNRAVRLSDAGRDPNYVWVSAHVRKHMTDEAKLYSTSERDMWTKAAIEYNGATIEAWKTPAGWKF
jgi:class 3 adenylate cyclase